jgi:predicted branched-subunit amino acid permease
MKNRQMRAWYLGISLLSFVAGGCGTLTGATAGAGIGAATHSNVGKALPLALA